MKFFHVYDSESFEGLVKNNLINEDTGFKIQHVFAMPNAIKFNEVAAKGGFLHNLIKEGNYPFYVDRLTGGLKYHPYVFSRELIDEYRDMLGNWFLGFQLHELSGNRRHDWDRIRQRMDGATKDYDLQVLKERLFHAASTSPDNIPVYHLAQGSPEEYAVREYPATVPAYRKDLAGIIAKRMEETDGMIVSCDSRHQLIYMENKLGVKTFLPEVGAQIPHMRIAVALARGMAKAYNKMWGTYYECWMKINGDYFKPVFNNHPSNEWHFRQSQFADDFSSGGANGGSSRLLQRRVYFYSLMAGAQFMGEEWGLHTSYNDMETFELSPYGLLKKDFIEFARQHKNVKAKTPFAIVLPTDYDCVMLGSCDLGKIGDRAGGYMSIYPTPAQGVRFGKINDLLKFVFRRNAEDIRGNEGHTIQNSRFGDLFDIIYADAPDAAFAQYDCLVDADPDGVFALRKGDKFSVVRANDLENMERVLKAMAKQILPVTVESLHWVLSEDENGRYVTVFNNEGNNRTLENGDEIDHSADAVTTVYTKDGIAPQIYYASSDKVRLEKKKEGEYALFVPATDLVILKY